VAALEPGRTCWTALLDPQRLGSFDDVTEVTAAQVRDVVERLQTAGHWRDGDAEILIVFDAGYDVTRLAFLLAPTCPWSCWADCAGLDQHAEVVARDRLMLADDRPVQIAVSRLPGDLARGTPIEQEDTRPGGIYARLDDLGHGPTHFTVIVSARMPGPEESPALALSGGTPVLLITQVAYDSNDRPFEVNDMVLAADHYELVYEVPGE
jgi:hypothetical protein